MSALNELLEELEVTIRDHSEVLIAELALRDELEYEKVSISSPSTAIRRHLFLWFSQYRKEVMSISYFPAVLLLIIHIILLMILVRKLCLCFIFPPFFYSLFT